MGLRGCGRMKTITLIFCFIAVFIFGVIFGEMLPHGKLVRANPVLMVGGKFEKVGIIEESELFIPIKWPRNLTKEHIIIFDNWDYFCQDQNGQ